RLQGKSQVVQDELARLGESMVTSAECTRAIALELCREFEDKFLQHITTDERCAKREVMGGGVAGLNLWERNAQMRGRQHKEIHN
ncbi:dynamin-2B, partial [Trifolium pratense]